MLWNIYIYQHHPQDVPRLQERAKSLVSQLIGEREGSVAKAGEDDLPDPCEPSKDTNGEVVPVKRRRKRSNVYHEESQNKRTKRIPAKYLD